MTGKPTQRRELTLANGLRAIIAERPGLHTATLAMYVRAGSRFEGPETCGISHFLEHMFFRGTRSWPTASLLSAAIETLGGTLGAATHADFTVFEIHLPRESVARAIPIFAEVFTAPTFDAIETERRIVKEEILADLDETGRDVDADNLARRTMFPRHALGASLTGAAHNLDLFDRRALERHRARLYRASNMVLSIAGGVDASELTPVITRAFSPLRPGKRAKVVPPPADLDTPRFHYLNSEGSQTEVRIGFRTFGIRDPRSVALRVLMRVLDDGMSTRLHRRIVDELGLAYEVFGTTELYEDCGVFEIGAAVAHAKVGELVAEVLALFEGLARELVTEEELDKAKRRYRWQLEASYDDPASLATFEGLSLLLDTREHIETLSRAVEGTTRGDVLEAARALVRQKALSVSAVGVLRESQIQKARKAILAVPG